MGFQRNGAEVLRGMAQFGGTPGPVGYQSSSSQHLPHHSMTEARSTFIYQISNGMLVL